MTEEQRLAWNAAVAGGDQELIPGMQRELLDTIHHKIMTEDINYQIAGYEPG